MNSVTEFAWGYFRMAWANYEFPHSHNYDSDLRELISLVQKYRNDYQDIESTVDSIEQGFKSISSAFEELDKKVDSFYGYVDNTVNDALVKYKVQIDAEIADIKEQVSQALESIANILPTAEAYADAKDELLRQSVVREVLNLISDWQAQLDDLQHRLEILKDEIINPFSGFRAPVGTVVEMMDRHFRYEALTNYEYEDLGLTNDEYAAERLTDWQYLLRSKTLLQKMWTKHLNPVTGMLTTEYNVASYIATMCQNTQTANDYAARNLTNDEYEAYNLTVEEYFFSTPQTQWSVA